MAAGIRLACTSCQFAIVAWDDGNPFYLDERGRKRYAHHPNHEALARCIGNDVPHLCLECGAQARVDSRRPRDRCRRCRTGRLVATWELAGHTCPRCHEGRFAQDPEFIAIS